MARPRSIATEPHGRRSGPQTSRHRHARSARRAPKARSRARATCRTLRSSAAAAALLVAAAPPALAGSRRRWPSGLRFDARALADADVMQQRLALVSLPALLAGAGRRRADAGGGAAGAACSAAAGTSACKALQPKFEKLDPLRRPGAHVLRAAARRHAEGLPAGADAGRHRRVLPARAPAALRAAPSRCRCRRRWRTPAAWCWAACCCWCWRWRCSRSSTCRCSATCCAQRLKMSRAGSEAGAARRSRATPRSRRKVSARACARWPTAACWPRCPRPTWW